MHMTTEMETVALERTAEVFDWPFSRVATSLEASIIREILKISSKPGVINFAGGLPAPELFPIEKIRECVDAVLTNNGPASLQYSLTSGILPLREFLAEHVSKKGLPVTAENITITTGSQQGLDLVGRAFLEPGDYVLTELPTYLGALQAFNFYQAIYCPVEMDNDGLLIEQADEKLKQFKPKFMYLVPNFQNPSGITMSLERRQAVIDLAFKYSIPIVDDNPYGELRFSGKAMPSLRGIGGDAVIGLGTFSKLISPGLRIGWVVAPIACSKVIERVKQATDLHSATFPQYVIYEFLKRGYLEPHIERIRVAYAERLKVMEAAMHEHFPCEVTWPHPEGGLFLWLQLPEHVSAMKMLNESIEAGVAFVPGRPFHPDGSGDNTMRLNFANATLEGIVEGIKRLATVLKKHC
jgi:2-aminoadipate transaminase